MWRLRGPLAEYDAAARWLRIGGTVLDLRATPAVPAELAVGRVVVARTVRMFDPATQRGELRGVQIYFSAAVFPGGNHARLAVGAAVRVQGPLTAGGTVLRAQRVFPALTGGHKQQTHHRHAVTHGGRSARPTFSAAPWPSAQTIQFANQPKG